MPGARDDPEELRDGVEEVEYLGKEEQQESLAEVTKDADHSKRHASKVAVCVTYKHCRRIPGRGVCVCVHVCVCVRCILTTMTESNHYFPLELTSVSPTN